VDPEASLDALWKRKKCLVSPGTEPEFDDSLAHSIVIVQTGVPGSLTMVEEVQCRAHCERRSLSSRLRVPKRVQRTLLNP